MNIDYTITALMFPAIPLTMSIYSNRFHTLSSLIRKLHDEFVFESDASDVGIGGCLKAVNANGEFIVGYCSKKFDTERNWNIVEKEAFAIVHGVQYFRHYLVGHKFIIKCDNRVVCCIKRKHKPRNKKMLNWALELSEFDYDVQHIRSKNNASKIVE